MVVYVEQRMGTATAAAVPVSAPAAAGKVTARRPAPKVEVAPKRPVTAGKVAARRGPPKKKGSRGA
ncbi:MAG: hypothetical protein DMD83_05360 [Candidatus Rokuibacteriota bacterium]|nr:MAG: hypothetical protein DMD83_05360 [Candidatus Rokubacteria bacterium]